MKMDFKGKIFSASFAFLFAEIIILTIFNKIIITEGFIYTLGLSSGLPFFFSSREKPVMYLCALITLLLIIYSIYRLVMTLIYNRKNCRQAYILELSIILISIFLALTTFIFAMSSTTQFEGEIINDDVRSLLAFGEF